MPESTALRSSKQSNINHHSTPDIVRTHRVICCWSGWQVRHVGEHRQCFVEVHTAGWSRRRGSGRGRYSRRAVGECRSPVERHLAAVVSRCRTGAVCCQHRRQRSGLRAAAAACRLHQSVHGRRHSLTNCVTYRLHRLCIRTGGSNKARRGLGQS